MIDYESLLGKYMREVMMCEGTTFVDHGEYCQYNNVDYTEEEWAVLSQMSRKLYKEDL